MKNTEEIVNAIKILHAAHAEAVCKGKAEIIQGTLNQLAALHWVLEDIKGNDAAHLQAMRLDGFLSMEMNDPTVQKCLRWRSGEES